MSRSPTLHVARFWFALVLIVSECAWAADAKIEAGATIYGNYCSNCHGDGLRNTSGGATFDLTRLRAGDHDRFVNSVLNGKTQMPPWRGVLDMEQIESIWSFIRATVDRGECTVDGIAPAAPLCSKREETCSPGIRRFRISNWRRSVRRYWTILQPSSRW
jgi:mono/diheme cytochrome c family protein